jgi:hypothetical protein
VSMKTAYRYVVILVLCLCCVPGAHPAAKDFAGFFAKWKAAVEQRDENALTAMMASPFAFIRAENVAPADVFRGLDANGGLQWQNLQQAAQRQPVSYRSGNATTPAKVLQCTPTEPTYSCLVMFTQDSQLGWRWKGMIMPTR